MSEIVNIKMLDPHLQKLLTAYGITPERDPEASHRTRERFMAELDKMFAGQAAPKPIIMMDFTAWISNLLRPRDGFALSVGKRAILYAIVALLVFGIFLSSGIGITAYAAASSLPGDLTYPLKTTFENVRAGMTIDSANRARLYVGFAGRRLSEIQSLIADDRYADISQAANEFGRDIKKALDAVEGLSRTDPARAADLNAEISGSLRGYSDILTKLLAGLPADVQPVLQNAIGVSRAASGEAENDDDGDKNSPPGPSGSPDRTPRSGIGDDDNGDDDNGHDDGADDDNGHGNDKDDDSGDDDDGRDNGGRNNGGRDDDGDDDDRDDDD